MFERPRQYLTSLGMRALKQRQPTILSQLEDTIPLLQKEGITKLFITTTQGFIRRRTLEGFFTQLDQAAIAYTVYTNIHPDPLIEDVEKGLALFQAEGCQALLAIGGGSVIDATKIIGARLARPDLAVADMKGILKIRKDLPLLIVAPTTAGTGSEVTVAAVITGEDQGLHYKYAISDFFLIPRYAVLDPHLLLTLPPFMTATTGMDALTHAVEAYTNKFASPYVQTLSQEAVSLIFANLETAYQDGSNLEARSNMLLASYKAGLAFSHNFVGYVHALAHAMGALYGLGHGYLNAIILPVVLEAYGEAVYDPLATLADCVGIPGHDQPSKAQAFIQAIRDMNRRMDLPEVIAELDPQDFDCICDRALAEGNPQYPVPVIWGKKEMMAVLEKLATHPLYRYNGDKSTKEK